MSRVFPPENEKIGVSEKIAECTQLSLTETTIMKEHHIPIVASDRFDIVYYGCPAAVFHGQA